jgi:DNA integrity scanning protein DisA with diadenylate cyclase activity
LQRHNEQHADAIRQGEELRAQLDQALAAMESYRRQVEALHRRVQAIELSPSAA